MIARSGQIPGNQLARRSFQLITQLMLTLPLGRRRSAADLKELEFLTLALLQRRQTMIVGDLHRLLGVLPAQMSRIIRSLEHREPPLIACQINPQDKRKVDVHLTDAGEQALEDYVSPRIVAIADLLTQLSDDERDEFAHLLERLQDLAENAE